MGRNLMKTVIRYLRQQNAVTLGALGHWIRLIRRKRSHINRAFPGHGPQHLPAFLFCCTLLVNINKCATINITSIIILYSLTIKGDGKLAF